MHQPPPTFSRRDFLAITSVALVAPGLSWSKTASWPEKPIQLIVPSAPGGAADFVARLFARHLEHSLKSSVIVENRPGAGAIIGAMAVKNAAPDGYTYLISGSSTQAANSSLYKDLPYDPARDFVEVGIFGLFPNIAMVRADSPFKSIGDIIRKAQAAPESITYGYYSSSSQVPPALIQSRTGIKLIGAAYKNITQIITDIAGGIIDFAFLDALSAAPALNGLLKPIAVTSPEIFPNLPDTPPVARTIPDFEVQSWLGLAAPAGTPMPIVTRMNELVREATSDIEVQKALLKQGMTVRQHSQEEQASFAAQDRQRWADWIRIAGIEPQ